MNEKELKFCEYCKEVEISNLITWNLSLHYNKCKKIFVKDKNQATLAFYLNNKAPQSSKIYTLIFILKSNGQK